MPLHGSTVRWRCQAHATMQTLNLTQLLTFRDVVERGSFSAAALHQGLTQPAISLQVRQLERHLGLRLAERIGRRVIPTAAGATLLTHIPRIEAAVSDAVLAIGEHAASIGGRVSLGTGATACTYLLPPLLASLRRRFPALELAVSTGNTADMLQGIEHNTLDLGLVTLPAPGRIFDVTPILQDEFVAVFPRRGMTVPTRTSAETLARLPLVLFESGARTRRLVDDWFEAAGLSPKPVMALGSTEAIKELVGAGLGCGILPRLAVSGSGQRTTLAVRSLEPPLHRELALVMRRDKPVNRGLRQVVDAVLALRASQPASS